MVRLSRKGVVAPAGWSKKVASAFADHAEFRRRARAFEKLKHGGKKRRAGFKRYAAAVLPVVNGAADFPPVWRSEKAVKKALKAMTHGRCAYCQSHAAADQSGAVEHFKPKSKFPTEAYSMNNYFYSCEVCNLSKLDKWPSSGSWVRPDRGSPSKRFAFREDGRVVAAKKSDRDAARTIKDFGLDREGLREARKEAIARTLKPIRVLEAQLKKTTSPAVARMLEGLVVRVKKRMVAEVNETFSEAISQQLRK